MNLLVYIPYQKYFGFEKSNLMYFFLGWILKIQNFKLKTSLENRYIYKYKIQVIHIIMDLICNIKFIRFSKLKQFCDYESQTAMCSIYAQWIAYWEKLKSHIHTSDGSFWCLCYILIGTNINGPPRVQSENAEFIASATEQNFGFSCAKR